MDAQLLLWVAAAVPIGAVGATLWLRQRRRLAALQYRLREAEDSRLELIDETHALRLQLERSERAQAASSTKDAAGQDQAERRAALERVLAAAPTAPVAGWQDTQPMSVPTDSGVFLPTEPAELTAGRGR